MIADFAGSYLIEVVCKALFADLEPRSMITRGRERREQRRAEEERLKEEARLRGEVDVTEKKTQ